MIKLIIFILAFLLSFTPISARITYVSYSDEVDLVMQRDTGLHADSNCGVASIVMALDYLEIKHDLPSVIRNQIKPYEGLLYTNELEDWMDNNEVEYDKKFMKDKDIIINSLDKGVLMLCLDMNKVSGKDYGGVTGHAVIVVGYYINGDIEYLEVLDPMSSKIKYYKLDEVFQSAYDWWGYFLLFEKKIEIVEAAE